jgi:hypothetical protein
VYRRISWQSTEAVLILHPLYKRPALYASVVKGNKVHSSIELILLDQLRVGNYPDRLLPIYYEDDYRQSWSSSSEYTTCRITRYEQQLAWGYFRITAIGASTNTDDQPPVRDIIQGAFENIPVG